MCVMGVILFTILVAFASYFNFGARLIDGSLKNSNTAKVLMTKNGKDHTNTFVRQTRQESLEEALSLKDELQSNVGQTTPYYNEDGEEDLIETMPMLDEDSCSASTTNCGLSSYPKNLSIFVVEYVPNIFREHDFKLFVVHFVIKGVPRTCSEQYYRMRLFHFDIP